ncbi:MAG: UvrD-helicase domain-containing protein [Planctomycetia bacterium]|nr:UvrD-helicase domain-containing protein [Planctomycetia bacterium]
MDIFESLNAAQREAVQHVDGPLLVLAGPGSGKTRVMTHRIAYLLGQGIPDSYILGLTFTNKAAEEIRARVEACVSGHRVFLGTFHRFCARLLRRHAPLVGLEQNYTIYDTSDSRRVIKKVLNEVDAAPGGPTVDRIAEEISWAKNNLITPAEFVSRPGGALGEIVKHVYPLYQTRLQKANAADFDDLLLHVAVLMRENDEIRSELDERYRYILVDEYQDTNLAQYAIVRAISRDFPNLAVTGDPDQSIYGWRGANLRNILEFEKDYPSVCVVRLEENYRSTRRILRVADALIQHNQRRKPKRLYCEKEEGRPVRLVQYADEAAEGEAIAARIAADVRSGRRKLRDFAVLFRVNALSRPLEAAFHESGIPFQLVHGVEFFQRAEIKDLLAYLVLLNNPRDDEAFLRIVNTPTRGIGEQTVQKLVALAARRGESLWEAARSAGGGLSAKPVERLARFSAMMDNLAEKVHEPLQELLRGVLAESRYREQFLDSELETDQSRLENIDELVSAVRQFDERHPGENNLEAFLDEACLVNDTDDWEEQADRATMMTLHAAKGLEFPVVFIVAIEQGILPHERSSANIDELEEERRLLFVGMTRAQEELHLSRVKERTFRGQTRRAIPSPFLMELPREEMDVEDVSARDVSARDVSARDVSARDVSARGQDQGENHEVTGRLPRTVGQIARAAASVGQAAPAVAESRPRLTTADRLMAPESDGGRGLLVDSASPVEMTLEVDVGGDADRCSPDEFQQGMGVVHPEYGPGKIVALSGEREKRQATVMFPGQGQERTFVLVHSQLRPLRAK